MTGYAPTEVQMTGVVHEYSTIPAFAKMSSTSC